MQETNRALVERIMNMPMLQAEWVLWLLIALSAVTLAIIFERTLFFMQRRADLAAVQARLAAALAGSELAETTAYLQQQDSLETNVLLGGLRAAEQGPEAVEEIVRASLSRERQRYERALNLLAIIGSNAPFIGLFGTVLGIIHAFASLSNKVGGTSQAVMGGVSEALVATAVGLLVAIPAVSALHFFKAWLRARTERADQLVRTLLARLKADSLPWSRADQAAA